MFHIHVNFKDQLTHNHETENKGFQLQDDASLLFLCILPPSSSLSLTTTHLSPLPLHISPQDLLLLHYYFLSLVHFVVPSSKPREILVTNLTPH
jgi:hypothetical protein